MPWYAFQAGLNNTNHQDPHGWPNMIQWRRCYPGWSGANGIAESRTNHTLTPFFPFFYKDFPSDRPNGTYTEQRHIQQFTTPRRQANRHPKTNLFNPIFSAAHGTGQRACHHSLCMCSVERVLCSASSDATCRHYLFVAASKTTKGMSVRCSRSSVLG